MTRYAAFLRGVMPTNARMADLARAFEAAGFDDVKTVLGSGNVVFAARGGSVAALERKAEAAMARELGRTFVTIIRPMTALTKMIDDDPFERFSIPRGARRVVSFSREPLRRALALPIEDDGARILLATAREVFTA